MEWGRIHSQNIEPNSDLFAQDIADFMSIQGVEHPPTSALCVKPFIVLYLSPDLCGELQMQVQPHRLYNWIINSPKKMLWLHELFIYQNKILQPTKFP